MAAYILHSTMQQQRLPTKLAHPQGLPELAAAACQLVERILHDVLPANPDVQASDHAGVHPLEDGLQQQQHPFTSLGPSMHGSRHPAFPKRAGR